MTCLENFQTIHIRSSGAAQVRLLRCQHLFEIILLLWNAVEYVVECLYRHDDGHHLEQNVNVHADVLVTVPVPEEARRRAVYRVASEPRYHLYDCYQALCYGQRDSERDHALALVEQDLLEV